MGLTTNWVWVAYSAALERWDNTVYICFYNCSQKDW